MDSYTPFNEQATATVVEPIATNDGGAAFPGHESATHYIAQGMALRDYLAAKAIGAVVAYLDRFADQQDELPTERIAREVYAIADALIAERAK